MGHGISAGAGSHQLQQAKTELIESGAELIRLGPLNREAVAQVATDVLGAEADEELLQKAERVQGNPFLLVEFFRGLQDDLLVSLDSGRATLAEDRLPHRVSDSMRGRLARMSPASERAATFASGLGRRFSMHDLAAMTDMPLTELIDPVNCRAARPPPLLADLRGRGGAGLPIGLHPAAAAAAIPSTGSGWPTYYMQEHYSFETGMQGVMASLVFEGVFERFPKLRVC